MKQCLGDFADKSVCIIGLGYVGLTLATAMADVGFNVLGVEIRDNVLKLLQQGQAHFHEPGLEEKMQHCINQGRLTFCKEIPASWLGSVYIITVGTPLGQNGRSRLDMIEHAADEVARRLKPNDIIIMRSTVKLGTTQEVVKPILEKQKVPFDLAFCPERTLEGKALHEIRALPQIVGGITLASSVRAAQIFQFLTPTVVRVSSVETAELIKLIDNAQRDVHFAYANEVAMIADAIGVSAKEVIEAGKLGYPRTNLPMPGPVGGPCLEKDPYILAEGLEKYNLKPQITMQARKLNEELPKYIAQQILHTFKSHHNQTPRKITLMGIAFKGQPATDDLRGTMAKPIFAAIKDIYPEAKYCGYDAVVQADAIADFGLTPCASLEEAFKGSDIILILNNHPVFFNMPLQMLAKTLAPKSIIYDCWNSFTASNLELPHGVIYASLGSFTHDLHLHR